MGRPPVFQVRLFPLLTMRLTWCSMIVQLVAASISFASELSKRQQELWHRILAGFAGKG